MRAVVMRRGTLVVDEVDDPLPAPGQVLVQTIAYGICGSDLHALTHADEMVKMSREVTEARPEGTQRGRVGVRGSRPPG